MNLLYLTADRIGLQTGGGLVTQQEVEALCMLDFSSKVEHWDRLVLTLPRFREAFAKEGEPWCWDNAAYDQAFSRSDSWKPDLCHIYSGTFGRTVKYLKTNGCKVVYTIAAHDRFVSRQEHEKLGMGFPYPHLVEEDLWQRYIIGYRLADVIICPSTAAEKIVRAYGPEFKDKDIRVIPHGCDLPEKVAPLPKRFVVGYMGSLGADKGVRYLLEAWKKLNYKDAYLVLAGKDSDGDGAKYLIQHFGGGNILCKGWVDDVSDFYNSISLYIQPSCTEGFGLEVLEAMAHDRLILCSEGAGAVDLVRESCRFPAGDVDALAARIDRVKQMYWLNTAPGSSFGQSWMREKASECTWDKIRKQYQQVWQEVLR